MKAAELCAGYGGLALAVEHVFGAETAWVSEFEDAPSRILAHHWPNIPNHGDMTKIDWAAVEPVDIISGGTPCQDLSAAGKRAGMTEGTRSNLWVQMREAIATIKPTYVVWENVRGAYSAGAYSEMELQEGRMGADGNPNLRVSDVVCRVVVCRMRVWLPSRVRSVVRVFCAIRIWGRCRMVGGCFWWIVGGVVWGRVWVLVVVGVVARGRCGRFGCRCRCRRRRADRSLSRGRTFRAFGVCWMVSVPCPLD